MTLQGIVVVIRIFISVKMQSGKEYSMKEKKHSILVNMSQEEKELLRVGAEQNYFTMFQYIRYLVRQASRILNKEKYIDQADL